jgi:hypothetical protein
VRSTNTLIAPVALRTPIRDGVAATFDELMGPSAVAVGPRPLGDEGEYVFGIVSDTGTQDANGLLGKRQGQCPIALLDNRYGFGLRSTCDHLRSVLPSRRPEHSPNRRHAS